MTDDFPALTASDIRSLREARNVAFHHNLTGDYMSALDGAANMPTRIHCKGVITYYNSVTVHSTTAEAGQYATCMEMIFGTKHYNVWQTIVRTLKTGDKATLMWQRDGMTTPGLEEAGFAGDRLELHITKANGRVDAFHVADLIAPVNSVARMIRLHEKTA